MAAPIIFYSDFTSPHSYLAIGAIEEVAKKHGREVDWRVISLFQVWDAIGHQPLGKPRSKARYVRKDFERSARIAGLPFTMPDSFPVDAVVARQAFYRLKKRDPALATAFAKAVFDRYWREGKDIKTPQQIAGSTAAIGVGLDELAVAETDSEAQHDVYAMGADAAADGVFGTPFFLVDDEPFWGHDRVSHVDWHLAQDDDWSIG